MSNDENGLPLGARATFQVDFDGRDGNNTIPMRFEHIKARKRLRSNAVTTPNTHKLTTRALGLPATSTHNVDT
jgi:hypothetical protein